MSSTCHRVIITFLIHFNSSFCCSVAPVRLPRSDSFSATTHSDEVASHVFKSDTFLRVAMTLLPVTAAIVYQIDALWQLQVRNLYAGLASTIFHIFYFLQFYIHLECHSKTVTYMYTYIYHLIIWLFKVTLFMIYCSSMLSFRLEVMLCILFTIIVNRILFINVYLLFEHYRILYSYPLYVFIRFVRMNQ